MDSANAHAVPKAFAPRQVTIKAIMTREHVNDFNDLGEFEVVRLFLHFQREKNGASALLLAG